MNEPYFLSIGSGGFINLSLVTMITVCQDTEQEYYLGINFSVPDIKVGDVLIWVQGEDYNRPDIYKDEQARIISAYLDQHRDKY